MLDYKAVNIIEVTWILKEHWDNEMITAIPFSELKELIVDFAEEFGKLHTCTDWKGKDNNEEIISFTNKSIAKKLWEQFGEVPMNPDTEEIEEQWNGFLPGTFREDIWHWFEDAFHISVAVDLMGLKE